MKKLLISTVILLIALTLSEGSAAEDDLTPRLTVELEGGALWQTVNDIRIPNSSEGTRFSLADLAGSGPYPAVRLYVTWNINRRHGIRFLLAPFSITEEFVSEYALKFAGEEFAPGEELDATYRFNSWRISYRYLFREGERAAWYAGFTAKLRDAKVELARAGKTGRKTDLGFVPLLHLGMNWKISERWRVIADLDALAGGPGRAEDFSARFSYRLNHGWRISVGYRTLEGGADVDEVYSFAWFHYAVFSVTCRY
jgi:hypothetical protein